MNRFAAGLPIAFALSFGSAACATAPGVGPGAGPLLDPEPIEVGVVPPPLPYAPGFDALHYHIELDVPAAGGRIEANTTVILAVTTPRPDTLHLDLTGLAVREVRVARGRAGQANRTAFRQAHGRLIMGVPAAVNAGDTLYVHVAYGGEPTDGLIIRDNVHGQRGAFGDNWPNRARFWFPSIDHPSDKATVSFAVRAPVGWQVLANGRRTDPHQRIDEPPRDGIWRYEMPVPIPTYLMVIGATPFSVGTVDGCAAGGTAPARSDECVAVTSWAFPPDSAHAMHVFRRGGDMIEFYSRVVGPYPYTKLAHAQSATRFGGMENAGAIFYSERAIAEGRDIEGTVAHETAHQWFGNAVTPRDWPHLWLSEGFATYFDAVYFEHADGPQALRAKVEGSRRSYLASQVRDLAIVDTTQIPGNNLLRLLNANSYQKGGWVLHMLRNEVGDDAFFAAVRRYYARHVHDTAVTADLRRAFEEQTGRDLGWFFEQWLFRPGHPTLRHDMSWDAQRGEAVVTIEQVQDPAWPTFRFPLTLELATPAGPVRHTGDVHERRTTIRVPLPAQPASLTLDPDVTLLFAPAS
jgi:aminopeptidase N